MAAAAVTRSARERGAFEAIAGGLERLLAGRGGVLVVPRPGHPFSSATMEAAEEVSCTDASLDRTVAALIAPGLEAEGRTLRPAKVAVNRYAPQAAEPETPAPPVDEVRANGRPATADTTARKARSARNGRPTPKTEPEPSTVTEAPPAKRTRRKQPAKTQSAKTQPTSAMTSSETSASSETRNQHSGVRQTSTR